MTSTKAGTTGTCPCCVGRGMLPLPVIPTGPGKATQAVPADVVKAMCEPCIAAAFLMGDAGSIAHPHPMGSTFHKRTDETGL